MKLTLAFALSVFAAAQAQPITIRAGTMLDGKGGVERNVEIVVQDGKIKSVWHSAAPADYDLRNTTVLP